MCHQTHRVLDVGCGVGEFLIQLIEKSNARGAGVDIDARLIASAKENASLRIGKSGAEFYTADVNTYSFSDHQFDLVICLGSTHAFGLGELAYPNALQRLQRLVKPGGCLLIGEGYWKQSPDPDYLALLGEPVGIYHDFYGNIEVAKQIGLIPIFSMTSSADEWDDFETSHQVEIERAYRRSPEDPEIALKLEHRRRWMDGYFRWGRDTMGFAFYAFRVPEESASERETSYSQ